MFTDTDHDTCANASSNGSGIGVNPQCFKNEAEVRATIEYNHAERDSMLLCQPCADALEQMADKHGYSFEVNPL